MDELDESQTVAQNESVNISDNLKRTPLHVASSEGKVYCRFLVTVVKKSILT